MKPRDADEPFTTLTPESFWQLPIADVSWLRAACGVSDATAKRLLEVLNAHTVRIGARTFLFPRRLLPAIERLADNVEAQRPIKVD